LSEHYEVEYAFPHGCGLRWFRRGDIEGGGSKRSLRFATHEQAAEWAGRHEAPNSIATRIVRVSEDGRRQAVG
jgi:hypothetical protein